MKKILVIIDMVNGFVNEGALADPKINEITPNIIKLINEAKEQNIPIIAFRDCHKPNDPEFEIFPEHCLDGSYESELIPELKTYEKDFVLNIPKTTTNGFITYAFQKLVQNYDFDEVIVTGCCTDICVQNFVESYLDYAKKENKATRIKVVSDACATFDSKIHVALLEHDKALYQMQQKGAELVVTHKALKKSMTEKRYVNMEDVFYKTIQKRDKLVFEHYGNNLAEQLNYPEQRAWYVKNVIKLDNIIIQAASILMNGKKYKSLAEVYADSELEKKYKTIEARIRKENNVEKV